VDVHEYFLSREQECRRLSVAPDRGFDEIFGEEEGSNGTRGIMWGRLVLSDRAYLQVGESVVVVGTGVHRESYHYYLVIGEYEVWGYDRDPDHDPPEHMHIGDGHDRHPAGRIEFHEVVEKAWETLSQEEDLAATTEEQ